MNVEIYDSTLRDGEQGEGLSFSVLDKLRIVTLLDKLGVQYIEAGNPGSNPKDLEFFEKVKTLKLENSTLVAFGSTHRIGVSCTEDSNLKALIESGTKAVAIFGKSWDFQVERILKISKEENLALIENTIRYLNKKGKYVFFDAEHFFDGFQENKEYALLTLSTALRAGADELVLCETRGGMLPLSVYEIVKEVKMAFPNAKLGVHTHNDIGCAVASSLLAVKGGVSSVQGTLLGFGERCGNANLSTIIATLTLKQGIKTINGPIDKLVSTCRELASIANYRIPSSEPYIGKSAFAHKGGMHIDGVLKSPDSFEHINPDSVGATRRLLISEVAGRALVLKHLEKYFPQVDKEDSEAKALLSIVKEKEALGYQYEGAVASFELLVRRKILEYKAFFSLVRYETQGSLPYTYPNTHTAVIKVRVGEDDAITATEGKGPVNALDKALRKVLEPFYPIVKEVVLTDYKVRVLDGKSATASKVRVVIESSDGDCSWTTVGVSEDIIEASWLALTDSIEYKLFLDGTKPRG
ncbi:MAG: citramalate synthase [Spirochaetales bacterium]|nr:citramalate synthase [Spirochaetales bacterium]